MRGEAVKRLLARFFYRIHLVILVTGVPRWAISSLWAALIIGYNELAKQQTQLGQKAVCRSMRKIAIDSAGSFGLVVPPMIGNPITFTISMPEAVPPIEFRESDWEMMRKELAAHDAKSKEATP
jgi:hypothetical protein